jgi:DNA-directed RNA polymerase specialized sigma24 family protein
MRGQELSPQQRERIIGAHLLGTKGIIIATQLSIPSSTVYDAIKRYKKKTLHILTHVPDDQNPSLNVTSVYYNVMFEKTVSHL